MAHEITQRADGFNEMAFVGETPWHGLGQELQEGASIEQWQKAAGLDWTIESSPVTYTTGITEANPYGEDVVNFEGQNVLYRSDNNMPMSVVSNRYKPVQPAEVLEFFRDLVEESGFKIHTAGTLRGGKRMWALAETGKYAEVCPDDGIGGFLLLSTSADKTLATTARFTTIRVVCNNTLTAATQNGDHCVSLPHSAKFDHDKMKLKLGTAVESFGSFMEMAKFMQKQKMSIPKAKEFLNALIAPMSQIKDDEYNIADNRAYKKIIALFDEEAKGIELVGNTKWGMLNAVTEYFDHHAPSRTNDSRLDSTWFGNGERIKNQAVELLLTI
jgi:phage/plasmid-like protein (TIGR03299 family)